MSGKTRGVFEMIFKAFFASLKPNFTKRKLMGEDYFGTKYYEQSLPSYSTKKRPPRYFEPINKDDHAQELPAEWEAWLRYRRKDPPTYEEILRNYEIALNKKKNAAELERKNQNLLGTKQTEVFVEKKGKESFPVYEEYEEFGQNYKPKPPY